ncbi:hypothetical protein [Bosea sp. (in: a-proteobacteria)]|uniref:hypothetical protein n=1 Tax=Bosea sp. (in: a-proteobacteria) TaxID=1871050 RepID=UPI00273313D0|nr:hypothetical protein [Bosea sp. (in: a-proteobacteria)]MDP3409034.1 hypothetical protein [Bosea sp. (in: a-proteobacteria)]
MTLGNNMSSIFDLFTLIGGKIQHKNFADKEPWLSEPAGKGVGYLLRTSSENGLASGKAIQERLMVEDLDSFLYPSSGYVVADFGGAYYGIHGFLNGVGDWTRLARYKNATWQIIAVLESECMPSANGGAHRAPRGWVVYSGDAVGAVMFMIPLMARKGVLSDLAKILCDDATPNDETCTTRAPQSSVISDDKHVAARGSGGEAFTIGSNRNAVAFAGGAHAWGNFGCAVTTNGGWADARGLCGDAIARRSVSLEMPQEDAYASAGRFGIAVGLGPNAKAQCALGGGLMLSEWSLRDDDVPVLEHVVAAKTGDIVNDVLVLPGVWYTLSKGKLVRAMGPRRERLSMMGYTPKP